MLGEIIKTLRKQNNLSQSDFATAMGYSRPLIANWERNERDPDTQALLKIANYFNVSLDYLLGREDYYGNPYYKNSNLSKSTPNSLPNDEQLLLDYYRRLAPKNKTMLFNLMKNIFEEARDLPTEQAASWIGTVN